MVDRIREDHKKEKEIIDRAHAQEIADREKALEAHKARLKKIEEANAPQPEPQQ